MIYTSFSKRQALAATWWNRPGLGDRDGIICHGAVRSGKTVCMTDGFFLWSMAKFDGCTFGLCGKTVGSLRRNVTSHLSAWLEGIVDITEHYSQSKLTVTAPNGHKNTYYLFGGENEASYQQIQGITLAGVLLDEAALMPKSFVEQACARCSVRGSKMWFNCNPAGPEHWFYKEFILKAREKNLLVVHFTMDDNPALAPEIRKRYRTMYSGVFYQRYVLGQWCMAEGLIYNFRREKHLFDRAPPAGRYYISVDYGTMNPFSAGLWCVSGGKAYRLREYYYNGREANRQKTDEEYYQALVRLAADYPITYVVVDPSAASFIAVLRRAGRFSVRKADNDVLGGIHYVAGLLQSGRLLFHPDCRDTLREFGLYSWMPGEDKPLKENDHAMDDIRYFCRTVLARERTFNEIGGQL